MIDILSIDGELLISVPILKEAVVREELMASDYVHLSWTSQTCEVLPAGSYIVYDGERYSLLNPYTPSKAAEGEFKYTPQFQSKIVRWQKTIVPIYTYASDGMTVKSRELDWTYTGTPDNAMYMVQKAILNETGESWTYDIADDLPETITITSQASSIWNVLTDIANQCETEWWAEKSARHLRLGKCSYGIPVTLEVGRNVKTPTVTSADIEHYTRFYAFGSTRNITQENRVSNGGIVNKRLTLDPVKYPNGYKDTKGHYENGVFVSDLKQEEIFPVPLYFEEIYPSSKLTISNVRKRVRYRLDDNDKKIVIGGTEAAPIYETYAIWYFQIPDFEFTDDLIIEGLELSAHFRSGQLRGREFALAYHKTSQKVADFADVDREFTTRAGEYEIIFDEQTEGFIIPSEDYIIPSDGDEVTLFNIKMPKAYTASAYVELEEAVDKEIDRRNRDNNTYEFDSIPMAFYDEDTDVHMGQAVRFVNGGNILDTRVLMVEKHLDRPFEQKIRIGNVNVEGSRQQLKNEVKEIGKDVAQMRETSNYSAMIQRDHERNLMLNMGRYYAMRDTIDMLQGAVEGFSEGINPVTVETMALLVGNESLQFRFTNSRSDLSPIKCPIVYDEQTKHLRAKSCALIHLTLGIDSITPNGVRSADDYMSWDMEAWDVDLIMEDVTKRYYVYAKVSTDDTNGTFLLSETAIGMRDVSGYYHLLTGVLNAEYAGVREFLPMYGFTQVLPAQVTTDVIRDASGRTYFDLANGTIAGNIKFIAKGGEEKDMADFADEQKAEFSKVDKNVQNLQDQIDGEVQNHFYNGTPTTLNFPAVEWATDIQKINHIGDTYTDIEEFVDSETTPNAGKSWRWCRCDTVAPSVQLSGRSFPTDWYKLGTIDAIKTYFGLEYYYNGTHVNDFELEFDKDIQIVSGPPTYVKIESATGDVYVKDAYGYFSSNVLTLIFKGTDYVEVTDKDGVTYKLHWHPIADTDAVKALLKVYELEKKVSDADYLRDTFKKGETSISGGVVMTEMVAVGEGGDDIDAFLNGSDFARIPDHYGKLILASGIPKTTLSGSTDLAERAQEAKTRIYENGVINSEYAYLDAGYLGPFFADLTKFKTNTTYDNKDKSMMVLARAAGKSNPCGLGFKNICLTDGVTTNVSISSKTVKTTYQCIDDKLQHDGTTMTLQYRHGLSSEVESNGTNNYPALSAFYVSCKGTSALENFAIYCPNGMFAGLRPRARVIKSTANSSDPHQLTELDHTIIINVSSGTTYIKLPASPQEGQTYEIYCCHAAMDLNINLNGKPLYDFVVGTNRTSESFASDFRRYITLVYAGGQWWEKYTQW